MHRVRTLSTKSQSPSVRRALLASAFVLSCATVLWAQPAATTAPDLLPTTFPTLVPPPTTAPAAPVVESFVGTITTDNVYVRSGPSTTYYELGKLAQGDLVQVRGQKDGWYQIAPPAGTTAYVVKEFVEVDASGKTGMLKTDYVNYRAATPLHPTSDYAVIGVGRKGSPLTILGSTEKYYNIVAPENVTVYVSSRFIRPATQGTIYAEPTLRDGSTVPAVTPRVTANTPTTLPTDDSVTIVRPPVSTATDPSEIATTEPSTVGTTPRKVIVPVQPSKIYNQDAETRFNNLNAITQAEFQKPMLQRDLTGLLREWQQLAAVPNISRAVKEGSQSRIDFIQKCIPLQQLVKAGQVAEDEEFQEKRKAYQQEWKATAQKIADLERNGPMLAEGRLETSTIIPNKYALVNPDTGRVTAYLNPSSEIELGKLLNQYVGVRGTIEDDKNLNLKVIKVKNATLLPKPTPATTAPSTQP